MFIVRVELPTKNLFDILQTVSGKGSRFLGPIHAWKPTNKGRVRNYTFINSRNARRQIYGFISNVEKRNINRETNLLKDQFNNNNNNKRITKKETMEKLNSFINAYKKSLAANKIRKSIQTHIEAKRATDFYKHLNQGTPMHIPKRARNEMIKSISNENKNEFFNEVSKKLGITISYKKPKTNNKPPNIQRITKKYASRWRSKVKPNSNYIPNAIKDGNVRFIKSGSNPSFYTGMKFNTVKNNKNKKKNIYVGEYTYNSKEKILKIPTKNRLGRRTLRSVNLNMIPLGNGSGAFYTRLK